MTCRETTYGLGASGWPFWSSLRCFARCRRPGPRKRLRLRNYLRQTWQTAEGLPQNSVRSIAQTRDGYLWFATAEGLVRFDGVRFTVFDRTSTPALPSGNIDSLAVAADGALWIGFRMNGIGRLHAGQFTLWTKDKGLSTNEIDAMAIDAGRKRLGRHEQRAESHP